MGEKKTGVSKKRIFTWITIILVLLFATSILDAFWKIRKISTGVIWQVPSKIYSDATPIIKGIDIKQIGLESRLMRLGYRQVPEVTSPGEYSKKPGTFIIYLRPFEYPEKSFEGKIIKISHANNAVVSLSEQENGEWERIEETMLEPEIIAEIFGEAYEDREIIPLSKCPPDLINAILSTEDQRFYEHPGIDVFSVMRATFVNIEKGGIKEGGSTITQQLVKNLFLTHKRTIIRKAREAWISIILEMFCSKEEILEMYINEIYMGQRGYVNINGMARAVKLYFDKDISQISLEEAAFLAGIIRAPNYYSPYTHANRAIARRNTVLKIMLKAKKISPEAYEKTIRSPLKIVPMEKPVRHAPYFTDYVLSCISSQYSERYLARGGCRIFTTMDMHMQSIAEKMFTHFIKSTASKTGSGLRPDIEGAVVISNPKTGSIKAMIGGTDYTKTQFNRAVQTKRHIGSLVKPIIYYTALRRGYTLSSVILDDPVVLNLTDGSLWTPSNFDNTTHGSVMLIDALSQSYNLATVRLGLNVGIENVSTEIKNILPDAKVNKNPSMLLGAIALSPLEVTTFYSPFANMGTAVSPVAISAITTDNGALITKVQPVETQKKLDPAVIFLVNEALGKVITIGTARASFLYGMPWGTHGKTGTTNDLRDSWFVGFTPNILVVTWLGNDDFQPIGLSGSQGATQVAAMILGALEKPTRWDVPDDIVYCKIDPTNGKLASPHSAQTVEIPFIKGTEPPEVSKREERPRVLRFLRSLFGKD